MAGAGATTTTPTTTGFTSEVAAAGRWRTARGRAHRTWFYPESGGQLYDSGTLGGEAVLDVQSG